MSPKPSQGPARWWPFARRQHLHARLEMAAEALERCAGAAERERARLVDALAVQRRALAMLHGQLVALAAEPARADALLAAAETRAGELVARAEIASDASASRVADRAAERVTIELAPARCAAEDHAASLRASLARVRGETDALGDAQDMLAVLRAAAEDAHGQYGWALETLAARAERAAGAAEQAACRIEAAATRLDRPAARRAGQQASLYHNLSAVGQGDRHPGD